MSRKWNVNGYSVLRGTGIRVEEGGRMEEESVSGMWRKEERFVVSVEG